MTVTTRTTFLSGFGSYKSSKSASDIDPDPEKAGCFTLEAQLTGYFTSFEFPRIPFMTFAILNNGVLCHKIKRFPSFVSTHSTNLCSFLDNEVDVDGTLCCHSIIEITKSICLHYFKHLKTFIVLANMLPFKELSRAYSYFYAVTF